MTKDFKPTIRIKMAEIETEKTVEEWTNDFTDWIESRNEKICSVIDGINKRKEAYLLDLSDPYEVTVRLLRAKARVEKIRDMVVILDRPADLVDMKTSLEHLDCTVNVRKCWVVHSSREWLNE